jgi:acetylornithine deacetylase/succinyl-diaminopimelate desuccinylase-like protein
MQPTIAQYKEWFREHWDQTEKDFHQFLSFPSISTDPAFKQDTLNCASWLASYLKGMGLDVELWPTKGHPIIYATHLKAGKDRPTLLIYHHYDVQPVDPLELWRSDPFKPVVKNHQIYARGAADDKGQCFYSISAVKAFLALALEIRVNIKFFIEGEEETGSAGTFAVLPEKREKLKADHLLIVDGGIPAPGIPAITLGMRGITTMQIECRNSNIDLHSGAWGGIVLNPNQALIRALSKMWDDSGKIVIPGFYDQVRSVPKEELASLEGSIDLEECRKNFGIRVFGGEPGFSLLESNWLRPTLEINGISGGYGGAGFKTVIPAKAIVKISCRLVPDQQPDVIAKKVFHFIRSQLPKDLEVTVEYLQGSPAYRSPFPSTIATIAQHAYEEVFEKPCRRELCGASIPIVEELSKASRADAVTMGVGLNSDEIHAPNEHFGLDRFQLGYLVMGNILSRLSAYNG